MICPQCGLPNLDQAKRCLRCNALLYSQSAAAAAPADRTPTRATSRRRWQKLLMAWKRRQGFVWPSYPRPDTPGDNDASSFRETLAFRAAVAILCGFFLPSWQQFRLGRRARGRAFLYAAVLAFVALVITLGTPHWRLCLWLLATVQSWSMIDALQRPGAPLGETLRICLLSFFLFFAAGLADRMLVHSAIAAAGWEIIPAYYQHGDLRAGMLVRVVPQDHYQPGDLVAARFGAYFDARFGSYYDRVIATGSHHVAIKDAHVYIDGHTAEQQPLNHEWRGMNWQPFTMQDNEVLVYASWLQINADWGDPYPDQLAATRPNLPPERVRGKVIVRWPLWHRQAMP